MTLEPSKRIRVEADPMGPMEKVSEVITDEYLKLDKGLREDFDAVSAALKDLMETAPAGPICEAGPSKAAVRGE